MFSCYKCLLCSPDSHSVCLSAGDGAQNGILSVFRAFLIKTSADDTLLWIPLLFFLRPAPSYTPCWCQQNNLDKETKTSTSSNPVVVFITHTYDCGRGNSSVLLHRAGVDRRRSTKLCRSCSAMYVHPVEFLVRLYRLSFLTSSSHIMTCLTVRLLDSALLGTEKFLVKFRKRSQFGKITKFSLVTYVA